MKRETYKHQFPMLWLLAGLIILLICFSATFEIDQEVRARGQMIPGSRTQIIQSVDGGMLAALQVREGDRVKSGQLLAKLEPDRAQAGREQAEAEWASKMIAMARASAEVGGRAPQYNHEMRKWSELIEVQTGIYLQRKRGLNEELSALRSSMDLAQVELTMHQRLNQTGDISQTEVMRAQRQVIEVQARMSAVRNKYLQDSQTELAKLQDELSASKAKLDDRHSVLEHTNIRSPADGIVKSVRISTLGGVLRPGDELMQISPVDDELIAEIRINPVDVGQLRLGLPVKLRFDALDSSIYGNVHGTLRSISPDTLSEKGADDQPQVFYRAEVELDMKALKGARITYADIKPGMLVNADIRTGRRTVLYYLAKPVVKAFSGALTQH